MLKHLLTMTEPTILIIDDEPSLNQLLRTFLSGKGYRVLTATDGAMGLKLAKTEAPDLVLCDLHLPSVDGLEVISRLRQDASGGEIPVIVLSGTAERQKIRQSMNLGGDDFIGKPASLSDILAAIEARLERRKQQLHRQEKLVQTALASYSGIINDVARPDQPAQWRADAAALQQSSLLYNLDIHSIPNGPVRLPPGLTPVPADATDTAFLAITGQRREYVKLSEVKVFLACGEYSKACWGKDQNMMFRKAMKQWERELADTTFVRVHRQAIINLDYFEFLAKSAEGHPEIHLRDFPHPVPVSQRCAPEFNRRLKSYRPA